MTLFPTKKFVKCLFSHREYIAYDCILVRKQNNIILLKPDDLSAVAKQIDSRLIKMRSQYTRIPSRMSLKINIYSPRSTYVERKKKKIATQMPTV